jgi:hypothetical protein
MNKHDQTGKKRKALQKSDLNKGWGLTLCGEIWHVMWIDAIDRYMCVVGSILIYN